MWDPRTWACARTLPEFGARIYSLVVRGDAVVAGVVEQLPLEVAAEDGVVAQGEATEGAPGHAGPSGQLVHGLVVDCSTRYCPALQARESEADGS